MVANAPVFEVGKFYKTEYSDNPANYEVLKIVDDIAIVLYNSKYPEFEKNNPHVAKIPKGEWGNFKEVKPKVKVDCWLNVYKDRTVSHKVKFNADRQADRDRIACIHIVREVEEGEGLNNKDVIWERKQA